MVQRLSTQKLIKGNTHSKLIGLKLHPPQTIASRNKKRMINVKCPMWTMAFSLNVSKSFCTKWKPIPGQPADFSTPSVGGGKRKSFSGPKRKTAEPFTEMAGKRPSCEPRVGEGLAEFWGMRPFTEIEILQKMFIKLRKDISWYWVTPPVGLR